MRAPIRFSALALVAGLGVACGGAAQSPALGQADAVAISPAAERAREEAPQAHAAAEKLRAEAHQLAREGKNDEAGVVAEQARVAYEEAFATGRAVTAELRLERARAEVKKAEARLAELDQRQAEAESAAMALELRARVVLDTEPVSDVAKLSPERALARRAAAQQLTSEARSLCVATQLLDPQTQSLTELDRELGLLDQQLSVGSVQKDLYPRAAKARSGCLHELTLARRPATRKAPEAGTSDRLLTALTETQQVFAFRDDRGVVVNVLEPTNDKGELTDAARSVFELLGKTAQAHPESPLLVVVHTAKKGQEKAGEATGRAVSASLEQAGAKGVAVQQVGATQPVVDRRVPRAEKQNSRVEVVFVTPSL
jgi:hypothetical protein